MKKFLFTLCILVCVACCVCSACSPFVPSDTENLVVEPTVESSTSSTRVDELTDLIMSKSDVMYSAASYAAMEYYRNTDSLITDIQTEADDKLIKLTCYSEDGKEYIICFDAYFNSLDYIYCETTDEYLYAVIE